MSDAVNSNAVNNSVREVNFDGLVGPTHNYEGWPMATWHR